MINDLSDWLPTAPNEIKELITQLKIRKAPGADATSPEVPKSDLFTCFPLYNGR